MTHISKFRYGEKLLSHPNSGKGCGEVRVSYFDPRTGKPCKSKPKPLDKKSGGNDSYERNAKRTRDIEEAAEIMCNMKERNAAKRKPKNYHGSVGRPVIVDGFPYKSVTEAAREIGISGQYLGKVLLSGRKTVKGRHVEFAEEAER